MSLENTISLYISLGALTVSVFALVRTVVLDRRNRRISVLSRKQRLIEAVLDHQLTLSELYSNVLTTNPEDYRDDVRVVLAKMRESLPKMIADADTIQQELKSTLNVNEQFLVKLEQHLVKYESAVMQQKHRDLSLSKQLQHGLDKGRLDADTQTTDIGDKQ